MATIGAGRELLDRSRVLADRTAAGRTAAVVV